MQQREQFATVILGSGQGGKLLAWHLAGSGQKVAAVERRWVGGSCPAGVAVLLGSNPVEVRGRLGDEITVAPLLANVTQMPGV